MNELSTLARPYAKAAFDFALKENALNKWMQSLSDAAKLIADKHFRLLINNPYVSKQQLTELFFSILGEALNEHEENFIHLLIQNDRLTLLPEVSKRFLKLYNKNKKQTEVDVTSAFELTDEQKKRLADVLEKRLRLSVKLNCKADKTILGGAIIRAGDRVFNYSGRYMLDKLASDLRGKH